MKQAFIYENEKSSKYWWIDYNKGDDFVVNFGKIGSYGRFQIKEFDNREKCEKEAQKIISSKIKKGYQQDLNFDFINHYYFDDEEYGLHPKTSHPNFVKCFKDDFYFDCSDDDAPFGSDNGADTLYELEQYIRKNKTLNWNLFAQKIVEQYWDMKYIPATGNVNIDNLKKQLAEKEDHEMFILHSDQVTIAVAFGQLKITGKINAEIKKNALLSLNRINLLARIKGWGENSAINQQMISDLKLLDLTMII